MVLHVNCVKPGEPATVALKCPGSEQHGTELRLVQEIRRRQIIPVTGLYVVGAWVTIEVASVFFPAWDIPDSALRYLFIASAILFPVVVLFGWLFDLRRDGLFRSIKRPSGEISPIPLVGRDYALLSGLTAIALAVLLVTLMQVWNAVGIAPADVNKPVSREENSVAILPFANLDTNPDTGYFSDGVSEEILHRLAATHAVHVLGRSSSFAFRDSDLALSEISRLLAVEYLLEGSVRRDGDVVRVTARLTDRSGMQVWSETFDRKLDAIFAIQSEIAGAVAARIADAIVETDGQSDLRATDNIEAYDEYLIGRKYAHDRIPGWHAKARAAFRRALELDPDYAPAHAGLAYALFIHAPDLTEEIFLEAVATAERSIELDPELAEGHAILGLLTAVQGPEFVAEGIDHLRVALELDPSFSDTYNWLSLWLREIGEYDEADRLLEKGHAIDPLLPSITSNLAAELSNDGEYDRAMRILERHTHLPELTNPIVDGLVTISFEWGRYADAMRFWREVQDRSMGAIEIEFAISVLERLGLRDEADRMLEQLETTGTAVYFGTRQDMLMARQRPALLLELIDASVAAIEASGRELNRREWRDAIIGWSLYGDPERATREFEKEMDGDPASLEEVFSYGPATTDLLSSLAFAYRRLGNEMKADQLLAYRPSDIERREPLKAPHYLEPMAVNAAMRGDDDEAFARLSLAIDLGWANYYKTINDPRWGDTLEQPRFEELLQRVQDNLAQQRARVKASLEEG